MEGRFGPFPKIAEDHTAAMVDIQVQGRPAASATSVTARGSISVTIATGSKVTHVPNVLMEQGKPVKVGATAMSVKGVTTTEDGVELTLALPRSVLNTIRAVHFTDVKGEPIESRQTGSGYMNESAELELTLKTKEKTVAIDFDLWQTPQQVRLPFAVSTGLGIGTDAAAPAPPGAPADPPRQAAAPAGPPKIAPGPNDGAASVDAVVSQMQSAVTAAKGRETLAVIYPDDRTLYGTQVATMLAFSALAAMGDDKAMEKAQKDIDALFAKHKVKTPLNGDPNEVFKNTDLAAFLTDSFTYLKGLTKKGEPSILPVPSGKAQDVKITGDSAVGKLEDKDVTFVRINNKWFMRVPK
jgi:hypothetical protein